MKIGIFTPSWPPGKNPNGIVSYYGSLIDALKIAGHEVFVVCGRLDDEGLQDEHIIPILRNQNRIYRKLVFILDKFFPGYAQSKLEAECIIDTFKVLHQRVQLDIVEMEESFGWFGRLNAKLNIPVVVKLHGPHFMIGPLRYDINGASKNDEYRINFEGKALKKSKYITAPSSFIFNKTNDFYSLDTPKAKVIPNPIKMIPIERCWEHDKCDKNKILFVGRFDFTKGGDLVLKAFAKFLLTNSSYKLVFVGPDIGVRDESNKIINLHNYIKKYLPDLPIDNIEYTGTLASDKIEKLRVETLLTLVPSRMDNFPTTILEAMAFGCPIITTSVGGITEMVNDGKSAIVVESENVDLLAKAMIKLVTEPELAKKLGNEARLLALEKFLPDVIAEQTADYYLSVIEHYSETTKV